MASILIVEDEAVVALMIADVIRRSGHSVFATVSTVGQAIACLRDGRPDAALVDLCLADGELSYPVAADLKRLGIKFAFATGYEAQSVDDSFAPAVVLRKPLSESDIIIALGLAPTENPAPQHTIARKSDPAMAAMLHNAEAGDVLSQTNLATIHENQRRLAASPELSQDNGAASFHHREALKWWRRAATQGSGKAQASLALLYANGDGVKRDPVQALMWYVLSGQRLHGEEADRAGSGRLKLVRRMDPSDVREAEQRAALWKPHLEQDQRLSH